MTDTTATPTKKKSAPKKPASKTRAFPSGEPVGYIASQDGHVEVKLRGNALERLRRLQAGLVDSAAQLENGRPVVTKADVVRWVFENLD